jgi:Ca2+-binding RTX toxin-like protein
MGTIMASFTGTDRADTIAPAVISAGVGADPAGSKPSAASDVIFGRGGNDTLDGGYGRDEIHGGDGRDGLTGDGELYGDGGNDVIKTNGTVNTTAHGGTGNDDLYGYANSGVVSLYGDSGDDVLRVSSDDGDPRTFLYGGDGNDTLEATSNFNNAPFGVGVNTLAGGSGDDTYVTYQATDKVVEATGAGIDTLRSWSDFTLPDNVENLTLLFTEYVSYGNVRAVGNGLGNVIRGNSEDNRIEGMAGNDTIYGRDTGLPPADIYGDRHSDADLVYGGDGNDRIYGGDGRATWDGGDALFGGAGNDGLYGQAGADRLYGDGGDDGLSGGSGDDELTGGPGRDVLNGNAGNDVYRYTGVADSRAGADRDEIFDFAGVGGLTGDKIDVSKIDADVTAAGLQHFTFVIGPLSGPGQLHVVDAGSGDGSVIQGEVDGAAGSDFAIGVDDGAAAAADWTADDFIL